MKVKSEGPIALAATTSKNSGALALMRALANALYGHRLNEMKQEMNGGADHV
ncbi:hypothetical protein [Roseospira marina]|uniref:hypothetical protein n=1 Tax=Roseospira marina TaxID=140057 RepID=UPI00161AABD2|nr:hypothetical protein [Roseospira marina]MBB5088440.1 hypothetical protein [Roseospira marina]